MENSFCVQCGAKLLPAARFCVECGEAIGERGRGTRRSFPLDRYAPAAVVGVVLLVGSVTVWWGHGSANPPKVVPQRNVPGIAGTGELPVGHPPIELPDDVRRAIDEMTAVARARPDDLEAWTQLGMAQYLAGRIERAYLDDAAATYAHVLERDSQNLEALRALGNIAFDRKKAVRAIDYYRRYLEIKPDDAHVRTDLGTMFLAAGDLPAAIEAYEAVVEADPTLFEAQFNLAIALQKSGEHEKAVAAAVKARTMATDEQTRQRVGAFLAQVTGERPQATVTRGATGAQAEVESIFRSHPIIGPQLDRVDWPDDQTAKITVRDFPVEDMPPDVRARFIERIRTGLREVKARNQVSKPYRVELVDAATGRLLETVAE